MPIVSSEITHDDPQIDGRRYIHERHLDDQGREYIFIYLAEADWDAQASLDARVPPLNDQLAAEDAASQGDTFEREIAESSKPGYRLGLKQSMERK